VADAQAAQLDGGVAPGDGAPLARGIHSSTFRLNVSAFCGIGGAFMGCLEGVKGVFWGH
jgi:hypothetical protein